MGAWRQCFVKEFIMFKQIVMYKILCSILFVFALGAVAQAQVKTTLVI